MVRLHFVAANRHRCTPNKAGIVTADRMSCGILVNPTAGPLALVEKHRIAERIAGALGPDCPIAGLDTTSAEEFRACAADLSEQADVLVVAGGDGTFMDVVNAVAPSALLAYVPLGSGNALRYALGLPKGLDRMVERIRTGRERKLDLILCDGARKALFAGMGIDGAIAKERAELRNRNIRGLRAYALAGYRAAAGGATRTNAAVTVDGETVEVASVLSIIVAKIPYYGYRLNVMPEARPDDGYIHLRYIQNGILGGLCGLATSWMGGNRIGVHRTARHVHVVCERSVDMQIQGDFHREGTDFEFALLPGALRMRY